MKLIVRWWLQAATTCTRQKKRPTVAHSALCADPAPCGTPSPRTSSAAPSDAVKSVSNQKILSTNRSLFAIVFEKFAYTCALGRCATRPRQSTRSREFIPDATPTALLLQVAPGDQMPEVHFQCVATGVRQPDGITHRDAAVLSGELDDLQ